MEVTDRMLEEWREQIKVQLQPQDRCETCRHLRLLPLQRPGLYTGQDGYCALIDRPIQNARTTVCNGYQSDLGPRRERTTIPQGSGMGEPGRTRKP